MKKKYTECPILMGSAIIIIILSVIGLMGSNGIYSTQEYHPLKQPGFSVVFGAIKDGIYPWQVMDPEARARVFEQKAEIEAMKAKQEEIELLAKTSEGVLTEQAENEPEALSKGDSQGGENSDQTVAEPAKTPEPTPTPTPTPTPEVYEGPIEPLRESTYEEYINHISADIYGDAGVLRAAQYEFFDVDESYFDHTLFIGDSRTVGLRDYTDLPEHADFLCETSLTVWKVLDTKFKSGTVEEVLRTHQYDRIYLMVGVNELGRGTTEDYMKQFTEVVEALKELEPEAKIIVQATMYVSKEKSESDPIFNNENIRARNNAIATLADNKTVFYIDMNGAVCDEEGFLIEEYTFDHIHLLGEYNNLWKDFLLKHGVE